MSKVTLPGGTVEVTEDGPVDGHAVVLFHGFMVDERLWEPIVPALVAAGFRVVRPTLPIGSHRIPLGMAPTPRGVAHLVADLIEQLDLRNVTLVGNNSGGAMSQMLLAGRAERIGRVVLTNCDTADNFPPFPFDLLFLRLSKVPRVLHLVMRLSNATGVTRMLFGWLTSRGFDRALVDSWARPYLADPAIQAETDQFLQAVNPQELRDAETRIRELDLPVLLLWGTGDRFFTLRHARRLANLLRRARIIEIPDAKTFVMHDAPDRVATEIIAFALAPATAEAPTPAS
ncbi:MAG: alpha/beta fold hydrolase [Solirubrobacteraceae bacterium]